MCTFYHALINFSLTRKQQIACFENLFLSRLLMQDLIWQDLYTLNSDHVRAKLQFTQLNSLFLTANTYQNELKDFKAQNILTYQFAENVFSTEDLEDLFTYWCQKAYGRTLEQEVYELNNTFWMKIYRKQYLDNAQKIGLINEIVPQNIIFSETWIMGAARFDLIQRMDYLHHAINQNNHSGSIKILTGERELWAEIDGIGANNMEKLINGKELLLHLAKENNYNFNVINPFIKYNKSETIPSGRQLHRTYLNSTQRLTETDLCKDIYSSIFKQKLHENQLISTQATNYHRPTTQTTAEDAIKILIKQLNINPAAYPNPLHIQIQSNQPFILRQTIQIQRIANMLLLQHKLNHTMIMHGIGPKSEDNLAIIHSEFGALIAEKYLTLIQEKSRKRSIDTIMLQTRSQPKKIPPIPLRPT